MPDRTCTSGLLSRSLHPPGEQEMLFMTEPCCPPRGNGVRYRTMFTRCLMAALLSLVPSTFASEAEPHPRSVLANLKALEKQVTYSETKIPLGELVQKVAADAGVTLTASPGVADEPVAVVVKELPARE